MEYACSTAHKHDIIALNAQEEIMSPKQQSHHSGLVVIATTSGIMRAEILKAQLEYAGIAAILDYESAGTVFGITASGLQLSEVRILVSEQDAENADRILNTPPPPGWEQEAINTDPEP
jgi:hypothetical protein